MILHQHRRTVIVEQVHAVFCEIIAIEVLAFSQIVLAANNAAWIFIGDTIVCREHLMRSGHVALHAPHFRKVRSQLQIQRLNVGVQQAADVHRVVARASVETDTFDAVQQHLIRPDRQAGIFFLPHKGGICRFRQMECIVVQAAVRLSDRNGFELIACAGYRL